MQKFVTVLAIAGTLALGATAVTAQQNPIEVRKALMKGNGQQAGIVTRMVRGTDPYDAAKVAVAFDQWAETATKFVALFPENTKDADTRAAAAIWTDKAKFEAEVAKFGKDVADGRTKALASLDGLKEAMGPIGRDCGSCHEGFRKPQ